MSAASQIPKIALTGGPGGGKTALMHDLRVGDPYARQWLLVPEAAPLLFQAGLDGRQQSFQRAAVRLQVALEDVCAGAAESGQVLVCHRGTLDPLAYWLRNGWDEDEFFACTGTSRAEHFRRYIGVVHLQTAAIGAEAHYRRWPDAHRPESIAQAVETDRLCARAWDAHPGYVLIENASRDWPAKLDLAREALAALLSRPGDTGGSHWQGRALR
jgi:AAA domain-containing protein